MGGGIKMEVDQHLKQELLEKLSNFKETIPVYSIRNLSYKEMEKNAKYYADQFIEEDSHEYFKSSIQQDEASTIINLPNDTKMRIFYNSNTMIIKRKLKPFDHLIEDAFDKKQLTEVAINTMKRLDLDKNRLSFEQVEFERLWQIKASGITIEKKIAPVILCRIVGAFRRYINQIPVYGKASIFVKISGNNLIESVGIDWRQIEEKSIDDVKINNPESAAELILRNLNSYSPSMAVTSQDYKPEFFSLGYFSMPKKQQQNYMQPVYVAMFKSVGWTSLNRLITIPATNDVYEPICRTPSAFISTNQVKNNS